MKITSVNVRKIEKEGSRMKGIASVLLDDSFAVHDIRVIEGDNGLFIAMPSRKTSAGGYRDIAHPINPEVRAMFEDAIIASTIALSVKNKSIDLIPLIEKTKYGADGIGGIITNGTMYVGYPR